MTVIYSGIRGPVGARTYQVWKSGREFLMTSWTPQKDFGWSSWQWGEVNPGAWQLAYALLLDVLKNRTAAEKEHNRFAEEVLIGLGESWSLTDQQIRDWYYTSPKPPTEKEKLGDNKKAAQGDSGGGQSDPAGPGRDTGTGPSVVAVATVPTTGGSKSDRPVKRNSGGRDPL